MLINFFAVLIPFFVSFDRRNYFYARWKYLFPAIAITGLLFVLWDILYTRLGVWGFNPRYLTGIYIANLPVEEILFFITIPFACVFTYDSLNYIVKKDVFGKYSRHISIILASVLLIVAIFNTDKLYTAVTFFITAAFILYHEFILKTSWLGRFYFSYMILLIPFFIINGLLTGSFIEEEVVWYDNSQNLSIRIFTIPVEDSVYGLLLVLMNISFFEYFKKKRIYRSL
ncbi:MAG: lycopene cyclase domain-containing protein, partial [Bacteroidales bacterium]